MSTPTGPSGPSGPASPQRRWQAPCPGCGAAVEFQSAASPVAVCSYCRTTLVREGETLRQIGVSAELFQDHSPLQLGASGQHNGRAFTLVGRLQFGYGPHVAEPGPRPRIEGSWNEWYALFADGGSGWLAEDNDQYVFAFAVKPEPAYLPTPARLTPGETLRIGGMAWSVASVVNARLLAAQGELPAAPPLNKVYPIVDLRNVQNRVATLAYPTHAKPAFSIGQPVRLADLRIGGAATQPAEAAVGGRSFSCPSCGAPVTVNLADTKSITCASCHSLIDLSRGIGAELEAVKQRGRAKPDIPLGRSAILSIGELRGKSWQVVGFASKEGGIDEADPEEHFFWKEYLLYNREEGFAFLVQSSDGWTCYRTLTGVPDAALIGDSVTWNGGKYRLVEAYAAKVKYVEGEYYWRVDKDQRLAVQDYEGTGNKVRERLSCERSEGEVVWSWGVALPASLVASQFKVTLPPALDDAGPTSGSDVNPVTAIAIAIVLMFVFMAESCDRCDDNDKECQQRQSSGSYHK